MSVMNDLNEIQLRCMLQPIIKAMGQTVTDAMVLRVNVHIVLALENGAENEDIPDIIAHAIDTTIPLTKKFIDMIGEVDKANAYSKRKD